MSLLKPGVCCGEVAEGVNAFFEARYLLRFRTFGQDHSLGILSHYRGCEAGLEPSMVISMEPMLTLPEGAPGAGE